jgi:hypothetical protein
MIEHSKGQVTCRTVIDEAKIGKNEKLGCAERNCFGGD